MELKDAGTLLRLKADSWMDRPVRDEEGDTTIARSDGFDLAMTYCGEALRDLLDRCDVPQLKDS